MDYSLFITGVLGMYWSRRPDGAGRMHIYIYVNLCTSLPLWSFVVTLQIFFTMSHAGNVTALFIFLSPMWEDGPIYSLRCTL
jgi:hypothetical protein